MEEVPALNFNWKMQSEVGSFSAAGSTSKLREGVIPTFLGMVPRESILNSWTLIDLIKFAKRGMVGKVSRSKWYTINLTLCRVV